MNSFDSVLLCNDITSCYGTEQIELGNSSTADICFDPNTSKAAAAQQISFGTNTKELHI